MLTSVKHLFAYDDGDTIIPNMGVSTPIGIGLAQYINPDTGEITPDWSVYGNYPKLYPQAYSSKMGTIIVPSAGGAWYYNNPEGSAIIFDETTHLSPDGKFQEGTILVNGKTFPCLTIVDNLISLEDPTDKYIYYKGTYNGKAFTCAVNIPMAETIGNTYDILIQHVGEDGISGDNILSSENDYVQTTATLQLQGVTVEGSVTYQFQKLVGTVWTNIESLPEYDDGLITKPTASSMMIYQQAVDGAEQFRVAVTYAGNVYYKSFDITDIYDPMYIDDRCSLAGESIRLNETAVYTPRVMDRYSNTPLTGWSFSYTVSQKDTGEVIRTASGTTLSVTGQEVYENSGVIIRIEATATE